MTHHNEDLPRDSAADGIEIPDDLVVQYHDRVFNFIDPAGNELDDPSAWRFQPQRGKNGPTETMRREQQRVKDRHAFLGRLVMEVGPGTHRLEDIVTTLNESVDPDNPDAPAEIKRKSVAAQAIDLRNQLPASIFRYAVKKGEKGKLDSTIFLADNLAVASAADQTMIPDDVLRPLAARSKRSRMRAWAEQDDSEHGRKNIDDYQQAIVEIGATTLRLPLQSDGQRLTARVLDMFSKIDRRNPSSSLDGICNRLWRTMPSVELVASMDEIFKPDQLRAQTKPTESFKARVKSILEDSLNKIRVEYGGDAKNLVGMNREKYPDGTSVMIYKANNPYINVRLQREPEAGDEAIPVINLPEHLKPQDTRATSEAWDAEEPQAIHEKAEKIAGYLRRLDDGYRDLSLSEAEATAWLAFLAAPERSELVDQAWERMQGGGDHSGEKLSEQWSVPTAMARSLAYGARGIQVDWKGGGSPPIRRHKAPYRIANQKRIFGQRQE